MASYRLYTVVPSLLKLVDTLTNWYVRFNRKRLKGENGPEDATQAMNTLFEVLFTLCLTMAPFTPFLTENMYQTLKAFLPKDEKTVDDRSVHFLDFPTVRGEYFDPDIERVVSRMQAVIELGRVIRERKAISLKTPLKELVVIHGDKQYRADIESLEKYILEELNVRKLTVTAEEDKFGVQYRLEADLKVLGQKLKKDAMKVKKALPDLSKEAIHDFVKNKSMTVANIEVSDEDIKVVRFFDADKLQYETNSDRDVLVLLDVKSYEDLEKEGLAREVINRVQRLRKKANLLATDDIQMFYRFKTPGSEIEKIIHSQDVIVKTLKKPLVDISKRPENTETIIEEAQDVNGQSFDLVFVKP